MHCIVHGVTKSRTRLSDFHFTSLQNTFGKSCVHTASHLGICHRYLHIIGSEKSYGIQPGLFSLLLESLMFSSHSIALVFLEFRVPRSILGKDGFSHHSKTEKGQ